MLNQFDERVHERNDHNSSNSMSTKRKLSYIDLFLRCVVAARITNQGDQGAGRVHTCPSTAKAMMNKQAKFLLLQSAVKGRNNARGLLFSRKEREL